MDRGEVIRSTFLEALSLRGEARARFLKERCGADAQLLSEVESLLAHQREDSPFLEQPALRMTAPLEQLITGDPLRLEHPGDQVGTYRLLLEVGKGTYGTVWLAERQTPFIQRVALKIINPGMDSRAVIARFEQERQSLAVMDHPNVATVIDGGVTPRGRPYFVMEYVEGEPITDYADRRGMSITDRLRLLGPVCAAVQHAHAKGIIHRDLKPNNILVAEKNGVPVPKVIDFGMAKSLDPLHGVGTIATLPGASIGTPEYMSPEQASLGKIDVDTRSDVYSLGAVLYELISGLRPFDTVEDRRDLLQVVQSSEPARPVARLIELTSASSSGERGNQTERLTRMARQRGTDAAGLLRAIPKELESIVLKALRNDREHRYQTPALLAADIEDYLEGRPVSAMDGRLAYTANKWIWNHVGMLTSLVIVLAVIFFAAALLLRRSDIENGAHSHQLTALAIIEAKIAAVPTGLVKTMESEDDAAATGAATALKNRGPYVPVREARELIRTELSLLRGSPGGSEPHVQGAEPSLAELVNLRQRIQDRAYERQGDMWMKRRWFGFIVAGAGSGLMCLGLRTTKHILQHAVLFVVLAGLGFTSWYTTAAPLVSDSFLKAIPWLASSIALLCMVAVLSLRGQRSALYKAAGVVILCVAASMRTHG